MSYIKWSPDGKTIRFARNDRIWQTDANGNHPHELLPGWHPSDPMCCLSWAPDESFFLFVSGPTIVPGLVWVTGAQIWALDELNSGLLRKLAAAGCKNLIFGLESYSERVLGCMNKGVHPALIEHTLWQCREAGLAFNLQFFFGFPGETEAEARKTMQFTADQLHGAATLSFGQFRLQRGSPIARDPAAFGITPRTAPGKFGIELPYEPVASHAVAAERQLADRILEKVGNRNPPLGIDSHTLLYLYKSGVQAMEKDCYMAHRDTAACGREYKPGARWKRKSSSQTVREFRD